MARYAKPMDEKRRSANPGKLSKEKLAQREGQAPDQTLKGSAIHILVPPAMVAKSKRAKLIWQEMSELMVPQGMLCALDVPVFAKYCLSLARAYELEEQLERELIRNSNNTASLTPEMTLLKYYWEQVTTHAKSLGLTPAARKAMHITIKAPPAVKDAKQTAKDRLLA